MESCPLRAAAQNNTMASKRILSIGQCGADHAGISRMISANFDAEVIPCDSGAEARARVAREPFDLVLVNRILDSDGSEGIDIIKALKESEASVPVMLVSNHDDAQREAVAAGAVLGFGKSALGQPQTIARLRRLLG